jgi:hypothetical protein
MVNFVVYHLTDLTQEPYDGLKFLNHGSKDGKNAGKYLIYNVSYITI